MDRKRVRSTPRVPKEYSLLDLVVGVTHKKQNHACEVLRIMEKKDENAFKKYRKHQFPGRGQAAGWVAIMEESVNFVLRIPGADAVVFRGDIATNMTRLFGGDQTLRNEIDGYAKSASALGVLPQEEIVQEEVKMEQHEEQREVKVEHQEEQREVLGECFVVEDGGYDAVALANKRRVEAEQVKLDEAKIKVDQERLELNAKVDKERTELTAKVEKEITAMEAELAKERVQRDAKVEKERSEHAAKVERERSEHAAKMEKDRVEREARKQERLDELEIQQAEFSFKKKCEAREPLVLSSAAFASALEAMGVPKRLSESHGANLFQKADAIVRVSERDVQTKEKQSAIFTRKENEAKAKEGRRIERENKTEAKKAVEMEKQRLKKAKMDQSFVNDTESESDP